ncbi:MAG: AarF/UbiB family protein [Polyangia bacterium]
MASEDGFGVDARESATPAAGHALPEQLADDLEAMGPTYVKLGQVLAGRPVAELGVRISKAFSRFDTEPMAAASLGQVHRAALRDGRPVVVVKVQRPNIRQQIADDFEVLEQIAGATDASWPSVFSPSCTPAPPHVQPHCGRSRGMRNRR